MSRQVEHNSKQKSIFATVLFTLFLPIIIIEAFQFQHIWKWILAYTIIAAICAPCIYYLMFKHQKGQYSCPKCKGLWSYSKTSDKMIDNINSDIMKNERYIEEFICEKCGFIQDNLKMRKVRI